MVDEAIFEPTWLVSSAVVLRWSVSSTLPGESVAAVFFGDGDCLAPQALCVFVVVAVFVPAFDVADVVVDVVLDAQPRGEVDSVASTPLSEKLPNCSERFAAAAVSHRPSFRYCFGLVEADPVETVSRGIWISLGDPGTTVGSDAAAGLAGVADLTRGLPRVHAFGVVAFLASVVVVVADHSSIVDVPTSREPHPDAIDVVEVVSIFFSVFFGDFFTSFTTSTVSDTTTASSVAVVVAVVVVVVFSTATAVSFFADLSFFFFSCDFFVGLDVADASFVAAFLGDLFVDSVSAGLSAGAAGTADGFGAGSTGFGGCATTPVRFGFFTHAPVRIGVTTGGVATTAGGVVLATFVPRSFLSLRDDAG